MVQYFPPPIFRERYLEEKYRPYGGRSLPEIYEKLSRPVKKSLKGTVSRKKWQDEGMGH
jgi:hypothetical protein